MGIHYLGYALVEQARLDGALLKTSLVILGLVLRH